LLLSIKYGGSKEHPFEKKAYEEQDDCDALSPKSAPNG
jgi:hypothetical protein